MLVKNTREEDAGVLKSFWQGTLNIFVNFSRILRDVNNLIKKIKGRTLGNTLNAQADIPSRVLDIYKDGNKAILIKI